jgi:hypothetical protein
LTPGSNLLAQALRLIKPTTIQYLKYSGRTLNAARQYVASFDAPVDVLVSLQAVARSAYKNLDLDFQRNYLKVFAQLDTVDIARDSSGDRFVINGKYYQIEGQNNWFAVDGWASCLIVEVGPSAGSIT